MKMMIFFFFFNIKGNIYSELVPENQIVNQQFYLLKVMKRLHRSSAQKHLDLWNSGEWFLNRDNIFTHRTLSVRQFLASMKTTTWTHTPYSPDLAPSDFFLFLSIKRDLKERWFADVEDETQCHNGTIRYQRGRI